MFKYYINPSFHCFTQYYPNKKMYYELHRYFGKSVILLCALVKNSGIHMSL